MLPIGSIVLLKDGEQKLMVTGVMQTEANKRGRTYDYLGTLYPEGNISDQYNYYFNHDDIEKVYFRGYEDEERNKFIKELSNLFVQTRKNTHT